MVQRRQGEICRFDETVVGGVMIFLWLICSFGSAAVSRSSNTLSCWRIQKESFHWETKPLDMVVRMSQSNWRVQNKAGQQASSPLHEQLSSCRELDSYQQDG